MLKIRLQRVGKKNQALFRVVAMEHSDKAKGKYLELLGSYNPHTKKLIVNMERIKRWLEKGVQLSATINNLLVARGLLDRPKSKIKIRPSKREEQKTESIGKILEATAEAVKKEGEAATV